MLRKSLLIGALLTGLALHQPPVATAAAGAGLEQFSAPAAQTLIEKVQYRRHCRRWYRICRFRWGYGWRFRRCLRRHGC